MANYYGTTRTNYFRVEDEQAFHELMQHTVCSEDRINVFEKIIDGVKHYAFGAFSSISGVDEEYQKKYGESPIDECGDYDLFTDRLAEIVAEDDAVIITEVGSEKLRYVTGVAHIITRHHDEVVDIWNTAAETASQLLRNPNWKTRCDY